MIVFILLNADDFNLYLCTVYPYSMHLLRLAEFIYEMAKFNVQFFNFKEKTFSAICRGNYKNYKKVIC